MDLSRAYNRRGIGRRGGARGGGGAPGLPILGHSLVGVGNRYVSAAGAGILGNAAGFYVAGLVAFMATAAANYVARNHAASTDGWRLWVGSTGLLTFGQTNGATALILSPTFDISSLLGRVLAVCGVYTSTHVRLYVNGAQVGSGTAITGYTGPTGAAVTALGFGTAQNSVSMGVLGGDGVPSDANIAAWSVACKAARGLATMPGVAPQHSWTPLAAVANIADGVGSDTLTKVGTPVAVTLRQWGY